MSPLYFISLLSFIIAKAQKPVDPKATPETICLYENLYNLTRSNSIVFGHHHDNLDGQNFWDYNGLHNESDVLTATGEYPGFIEYDIQKVLNGVNLTYHILTSIERGLMVGWHFEANNPVTGGNDHDTNGNAVVKLMPGGTANTKWKSMLDQFAAFVKSVRLSNGNLIPMTMRILHECLGSWYWWGQNYCTPEQYKAAYNYTRSYLVDTHGLHNLLFVYAPNKPYSKYGNDTNKYGSDRYPGNDIIDIASMDCYDTNDFHVELVNNIRLIATYAKENNKIASIGEFGVQDGTEDTNIQSWWMSAVYNPIYADDIAYKVGYMNSWANLNTQKWWTPLPGNVTYDSFVQFHQQKNILFQYGVPKFFQC
eukprot:254884_1